jgi:multiple sugar transport system substrate-binding protein
MGTGRRFRIGCGRGVAAVLLSLGAMLGGGGCGDGGGSVGAAKDERVVVELWHPWGTDQKRAIETVVREFERQHPKIRVKLAYASNNLTSSQKLFLAIAGGTAPDVTFVDGQQLAEWAARGALVDITGPMKEAGLSGEDFWAPRWQESTFNGRVYAMPWGADPNFAMFWNKRIFREAGLDPERPPRTIRELDEYNEKITKFDGNGRLVRMGIVPWQWPDGNSVFTWGYAFGGDFYQLPKAGEVAGRVTADDPKVVAAMEWMAGYSRKYDIRRVTSFTSKGLGGADDPFFLGKMGMSLVHITQVPYVKRYAPGMEYGVTFVPAPEDGEHPTGWIGGWSLGIPKGAKTTKEAFEFMGWMATSTEGTTAMGKIYQFPAYKKSPYFDEIKDDPVLGIYYQILARSKHVRTLMPVQGFMMDLLTRAQDEVLFTAKETDPAKRRDAGKVLANVSAESQERLEQVMQQVRRREQVAQGEGR